jgi:hypothetical protein
MSGYKVEINQRCVGHSPAAERYGSWSKSFENTFKRIRLSGDSEIPDVVSTVNLVPGDEVFVVWYEYSSGDSFGRSDKEYYEVAGVFENQNTASELAKAIEEFKPDPDIHDWDTKYKFVCDTSDGQRFEIGRVPWAGYFERLAGVHVEEATLAKSRG